MHQSGSLPTEPLLEADFSTIGYCVLREPEAIGEDFDVYTGDSLPDALKALWSVFRDYGLSVPEKAMG